MTKAGWTLDDIAWERFDSSKVDQNVLMAVKAASGRTSLASARTGVG